jgi:hypothetical protein
MGSTSRTRNAVRVFTDDRERLTGAVTREKDKSLAHDVVGEGPGILPPDRRRDTSSLDRDRTRPDQDASRPGERISNDRRIG